MSVLRFQTASEVFETFPDMQDDMLAQASDVTPEEFIQQLEQGATPEDAITFCSYALDRRRAVWWGLECVKQMRTPVGREEEVATLTAEAWVREPEEHRRIAALRIGITGRRDLAATWVALAAGGSGGTLSTDATPGPPVPPQLCAKAVRTAILIALSDVPARERRPTLTKCLQLFRDLIRPA